MNERMQIVKKQWIELEEFISQKRLEAFARLIPLFIVAKNNRLLQQFFPYTSHERLCFSFNTTYPWSENFPCVEPIPNIVEFSILAASKETSVEISTQLLQSLWTKYQFLRLLDDANNIINLKDPSRVDWLLEQTKEMYTVYENTNTNSEKNQILGIVNTQGAINLLVDRIVSLGYRSF